MKTPNNHDTDVNGYLSELIRSDKKHAATKGLNLVNNRARFCSECVNDAAEKLDITV
ncbi:hypothetical protein SAMN02745975_01874 [Geosporobacter subterraneus DSM 17957]|uniref:Uncharacterized protein n=1 Tax=Geosporobacter subterraneus DSM 17957 TaxID=1121919 RepID=A0A1M6IIH8_9FIRM|nr:hypothetical protein [Geosporobacter subterraneus]SHJ34235.1 hypothetical protein SAMN02745975_01874 [Geosporobacter subterraneus DSM 17957]